jgi:hypothetical protein
MSAIEIAALVSGVGPYLPCGQLFIDNGISGEILGSISAPMNKNTSWEHGYYELDPYCCFLPDLY